jgi:hypothetical protein
MVQSPSFMSRCQTAVNHRPRTTDIMTKFAIAVLPIPIYNAVSHLRDDAGLNIATDETGLKGGTRAGPGAGGGGVRSSVVREPAASFTSRFSLSLSSSLTLSPC